MDVLDNAWDYNHGEDETRMGMAPGLAGCCDEPFLMAKVGGRNEDTAQTQLDRSPSRLRTGHLFASPLRSWPCR